MVLIHYFDATALAGACRHTMGGATPAEKNTSIVDLISLYMTGFLSCTEA